ncbi:MAG: hypothetical protein KatS3mg103_0744 [Phycisphaerales bacterium]|nr:MAG: hypothetical protein KatS3mg103_0744 [Phycisphaerales bacterium]
MARPQDEEPQAVDRGRLIVQKFGGSSVADGARIRLCAQRALDASRSGCRVVVVVSAMGRTTDALLRTAHQIAPRPPRRELDQLLAAGEQVSVALVAIAIASLGGRAVGLDARQAGIVAQGVHGRSRIDRIDTSRIEQVLRDGHIAVVAGFQGELPTGELATIGRGGSDTTAVALAAALGAAICEIYTDTSGVMTADPAIVPKARCLPSLSWPAMSALAARGAKVLALDAAELARQHRVPLRIRHAALAGQGTRIEGDHWPQGPVGCTLTMQPMPRIVRMPPCRAPRRPTRTQGCTPERPPGRPGSPWWAGTSSRRCGRWPSASSVARSGRSPTRWCAMGWTPTAPRPCCARCTRPSGHRTADAAARCTPCRRAAAARIAGPAVRIAGPAVRIAGPAVRVVGPAVRAGARGARLDQADSGRPPLAKSYVPICRMGGE